MALYKIWNGPSPTTVSQVAVTTGTAIKTMLQVKPSATLGLTLVEWGISFNGAAPAAGIEVEVIETDVAATVTAHVAAGIVKVDAKALMGGDPTTNLIQVGTAATGYTASAEGSITTSRVLDCQIIQPTNGFLLQFPLDYECFMQCGLFSRIRVKAPAAADCVTYMLVKA